MVLPGSKAGAKAQQGSPGTWEIPASPAAKLAGVSQTQNAPGRVVATSDRAEFEDRRHSRYRQAKATKRGGTGVWKSEPFIVPWKPGNSRPEDPVEGREGRVGDPWEGNTAGTPSPGTVSPQRPRIAALRQRGWC